MRLLLDRDCFMELDSGLAAAEAVGLDMGASPDIVGLEAAAPPAGLDELPPDDSTVSTVRSLAQPPTINAKHAIHIAFLSM